MCGTTTVAVHAEFGTSFEKCNREVCFPVPVGTFKVVRQNYALLATTKVGGVGGERT